MKKTCTFLPTPFSLFKSLWAITFIVIFSTTSSFADGNTHMIPIPIEERVKQTSLIVEGEVISRSSFWDVNRENIYTSNIIKVYKVFKGEVKEQQVEVITEGGAVGLDRHTYSSSLKLSTGQQGVFFLQDQKEVISLTGKNIRSTKPYGSQQGLIAYDIRHNSATDAFNSFSSIESVYKTITNHTKTPFRIINLNEKLQQAVIVQDQKQDALFAPVITSFSPTVTSAGTRTILTIKGSGFGNTRGSGFVEFKNADDGGKTFTKPFPREYLSWSDTEIKLYLPSQGQDQGTPGSGTFRVTANDGTSVLSSTPIIIEYAYSNVTVSNIPVTKNRTFAPRLKASNNAGGYTIQYAPSMQSRVEAQPGFQRAVTSWICSTGINWTIGEGTDLETTADDDRNTVRFASASDVGERVLARTISRYVGFRCGGDTLFFLDEFDMEINSSINWQYGPGPPVNRQFDFETVMLHELGHAHQLGHIIRPREAVMHYSVEFDRTFRDLSEADIEGGNFIMARSSTPNACNEPPIIPIPERECNIFANIINQQAEYLQNNTIEVRWTSTNETGVASYIVQRSANGINYTDIATVSPTGNNSSYLFTDTNPLPLRSYYRIKVVYTNGTTRFSTRVTATDPESLNRVFVAPNPISGNGKTSIFYLTGTNITLNYQLYDVTGKVVQAGKVTFSDVTAEKSLDLSKLAGGVYLLKWTVKGTTGTEKILKL